MRKKASLRLTEPLDSFAIERSKRATGTAPV